MMKYYLFIHTHTYTHIHTHTHTHTQKYTYLSFDISMYLPKKWLKIAEMC